VRPEALGKPQPGRAELFWFTANLLTSIRLVLGIGFPLMPTGWRWGVLLTAAMTEFLDGPIARLSGAPSTFGRILDPIADKVFAVFVLATLVFEGTLRPWQFLLITARDIVVTMGAMWLVARRGLTVLKQMPPSPLGKLATAVQLLFLIVLLASRTSHPALLLVASLLSIAAGIDYARRFR
jgi:CDP-diacylglycerol--glycerol-3-phosphate 3-phosphatidyltransferase